MPAKSGKQYRYMQMMAHSPGKSRKMGGPSEAVAREFISGTSSKMRKKYSKKKNHNPGY